MGGGGERRVKGKGGGGKGGRGPSSSSMRLLGPCPLRRLALGGGRRGLGV